jgi:hypothetical protein
MVCPLLPDAPLLERKVNIVHLLFFRQEGAAYGNPTTLHALTILLCSMRAYVNLHAFTIRMRA